MRDATTATPARRRPRDLRRLARVCAAVLMPIGPVCVSVIRLVIPGGSGDVGAEIALDPMPQRLVVLFGMPALFTLLPGAYAALHLTRRYRPGLTAWAAAFLIPGYLGMTVISASDYSVLAAHNIGLDPTAVTRLGGEVFDLASLPIFVFVVGHIVGTVLLGILAWRARLTPRSVAAVLAISQPLHLAAIVIGYQWLDFAAWNLTALGMLFLGLRILRTSDDEWDLPALAAAAAPPQPALERQGLATGA